MTANKLYILGFSLLAVLLLPVTGLWALCAYVRRYGTARQKRILDI